jgi:predicted outer membrane protein
MRNVLHGPLPEKWNSIPDASNVWRKLPYALLLASLFLFGVWPRLLTEKITPDAQKIVAMASVESRAGVPPAQQALQREQNDKTSVGFADAGRRDARPTLISN